MFGKCGTANAEKTAARAACIRKGWHTVWRVLIGLFGGWLGWHCGKIARVPTKMHPILHHKLIKITADVAKPACLTLFDLVFGNVPVGRCNGWHNIGQRSACQIAKRLAVCRMAKHLQVFVDEHLAV